ncbi:MAG TPA: FkbM family methyltransferase [Polyangiales bacterium]|nr:FkbM family methyltransferase [Polyangiales bacterium]
MDTALQHFSIKDRVLQRLLLRVRPAALGSLLKKRLGVQRSVITTDAGKFYVDPVSGFGALLTQGSYEPGLVVAMWSLLEPGGCFVDVGANEGYFSVIASKLVGASGRVLAIEPQQRLRSVLDTNFELNRVTNVEIVDVAVSDHRGSATLHLSPDTNTGSTALQQSTSYRTAQSTIETVTLEELLASRGIERVDLLKMDVEGFEYEAILGSPELFRRHVVRAIAIELHPRALVTRNHSCEEILAFLKGHGYRLDLRFEHNTINSVWTAQG